MNHDEVREDIGLEVQIKAGLWRVVEPQSVKALSRGYTRFYFPISRANFLEDKNQGWRDFMTSVLSANLYFHPMP